MGLFYFIHGLTTPQVANPNHPFTIGDPIPTALPSKLDQWMSRTIGDSDITRAQMMSAAGSDLRNAPQMPPLRFLPPPDMGPLGQFHRRRR